MQLKYNYNIWAEYRSEREPLGDGRSMGMQPVHQTRNTTMRYAAAWAELLQYDPVPFDTFDAQSMKHRFTRESS